jgi:ammonium transporter, Amt family
VLAPDSITANSCMQYIFCALVSINNIVGLHRAKAKNWADARVDGCADRGSPSVTQTRDVRHSMAVFRHIRLFKAAIFDRIGAIFAFQEGQKLMNQQLSPCKLSLQIAARKFDRLSAHSFGAPQGHAIRKAGIALPALACLLLCAPAALFARNINAGRPLAMAALVAPDLYANRLAAVEKASADAKSAGDNAWMLTSSALVLLMTGPGLALFYGGLVRKKNVLSTMMQSFAMMAVITLLWAIMGYSLAFGEGNHFIGSFHNVFLHGVGLQPDPDYGPTVPAQTYMIFQLMFAIITPALITGAFAERMKFSAMLLFLTLWSLLVYDPMAHMVWGKGGLLNASLGGRFPTLDFAGGTVVHITSGVSALVCALYLGKRLGYPKENMPPHSVVISFIGACLLWVGWFGFNAGSAVSAGSLATSAFVATHFGAAAAVVGWSAAEWIARGRPTALGAISGCVAGLVAITPASGFVSPRSALIIGLVAGAVCFKMVTTVKSRFGYDDSLDTFGVHGAGGTVGALLTGIFASSAINPIFKNAQGKVLPSGVLEGNPHQILNQSVGIAIAWTLAIVGTLVILKIVDMTVGLRVSEEQETQGLDLSQHGEEGYNWET